MPLLSLLSWLHFQFDAMTGGRPLPNPVNVHCIDPDAPGAAGVAFQNVTGLSSCAVAFDGHNITRAPIIRMIFTTGGPPTAGS